MLCTKVALYVQGIYEIFIWMVSAGIFSKIEIVLGVTCASLFCNELSHSLSLSSVAYRVSISRKQTDTAVSA